MAEGLPRDYRRRASGSGGGSCLVGARKRRRVFRLLRIFAGFVLLLLGVVGLFLPVLQGVLLILAGLAVLGRDLPWARAVTTRLAAFVRRRASRPPGAE